MTTYAHSLDEETYRGPEDSRETAIAVAVAEEDIEVGRTIWTAEVLQHTAADFFAGGNWLIDDMQERAYEDAGEFAENWLADVTTDQRQELEAAVAHVIDEWATRHGHQPTFFTIENPEPHIVTDKDREEAMADAGETA